MDLCTGYVISRRRVTETPVTELIIQAVENMALEQGITTLNFTGRHTSPIYPADWIAGVDYDQKQHRNQNDEDYIDEEEALIEEEIEEEELYDRIHPEEIADLTSTPNEPDEQQEASYEGNQEFDDQEPDPVLQEREKRTTRR
jgi:hypothetical protein